ncbi:MAG TPA: DUF3987 domain-containing protein [Candidatus Bathyarchaeia archaeon]|nr:DUF3987 domain-containing protein [Candidatus Bathyarchaeia archaeon]
MSMKNINEKLENQIFDGFIKENDYTVTEYEKNIPMFEKVIKDIYDVWDIFEDVQLNKRGILFLISRLIRGNGTDKFIGYTDASFKYIIFTAIATLSSIMNKKYYVIDGSKHKITVSDNEKEDIGKSFATVSIMLIGDSRSRKSTCTGYLTQTLEDINKDLLSPQEMTPESFVEFLANIITNFGSIAVWTNDEISAFFSGVKSKRYLATLPPILSRLIDGRDYTRKTRGYGNECVEEPFVNLVWATTPSSVKYFEEEYFQQGLFNRIIFVTDESDNDKNFKRKRKTPYTEEENKLRDGITNILKLINDNKYTRKDKVQFSFTDEALETVALFEEVILFTKNKFKDYLHYDGSYFVALNDFVERLAMIFAVDKLDYDLLKDESTKETNFIIDKQDVLAAIKFTKMIYDSYDEIAQARKSHFTKKKYESEMAIQDDVLQIIKDNVGKYSKRIEYQNKSNEIDWTLLYSKVKIPTDDLKNIIDDLEDRKEIVLKNIERNGRPLRIIRLVGEGNC